ncbi:hypothetical protein GUJ93_ZPchr0011g26983 [Zizania palustris]|uniref:Uncharacterized protein n=1 Tax=Zizania palustris TaxID=103762 RepID=A0A8J6BK04_ZIZPA|nr:hypothetical protein GUJ93_ZPchr0011g26983 [Zizania palustris]
MFRNSYSADFVPELKLQRCTWTPPKQGFHTQSYFTKGVQSQETGFGGCQNTLRQKYCFDHRCRTVTLLSV